MPNNHLDIPQLRGLLDSRKLSVKELIAERLSAIRKKDADIGAFLHIAADGAWEPCAEAAQRLIDRGEAGPLTGIPVALKDNMALEGFPMTCASRMLEGFMPPYSATVAARLIGAGAVPVGKTNMDEFAMGTTTETSYYQKANNPFDRGRVAGGSSGGSAAAVGAGFVPVALGSDTGGSIRQPAAYCGVTGIKPTYGAVSRYGVAALASSLDQVGVLGRSAAGCAAVLDVIGGRDERDAVSRAEKLPFSSKIGGDFEGVRLGVPAEALGEGLSVDVNNALLRAIAFYKDLGAEIVELSMPALRWAQQVYAVIVCAEASSNLAKFDGIRYGYRAEAQTYEEMIRRTRQEGFGDEVKRRILFGTWVLSTEQYDTYYKKACALQRQIAAEYAAAFRQVDAILTPAAPTAAPRRTDLDLAGEAEQAVADIYATTPNLAGLPALSTPCGYDGDGCPIGLQLIGRAFEDDVILGLADLFERSFDRRDPSPL